MATPEEPFEDFRVEGAPMDMRWQPGRAVLMREPSVVERADWFSLVLGLFGRRSAQRRPALTAEA